MERDPHAASPLLTAGYSLDRAKAAAIFIHGRGATAASILELSDFVGVEGFAYLAPEATGNVWYPHSFLEPTANNEPYLTSALNRVQRAVESIIQAGIPHEKIALIGFSQGACLATEFACRNPRRYGAVVGFSGGLIGAPGTEWNKAGSLESTPVFLGCSDVDFHIPVQRVHESAEALKALGGEVTEKIYRGMGHTVNQEELEICKAMLEKNVG